MLWSGTLSPIENDILDTSTEICSELLMIGSPVFLRIETKAVFSVPVKACRVARSSTAEASLAAIVAILGSKKIAMILNVFDRTTLLLPTTWTSMLSFAKTTSTLSGELVRRSEYTFIRCSSRAGRSFTSGDMSGLSCRPLNNLLAVSKRLQGPLFFVSFTSSDVTATFI